MHEMTVLARCKSCGGTGLYQGMAERDHTAVVCHTCQGLGGKELTFQWEDFEGRVKKEGITRVIEVNPGIVVGDNMTIGGMSYEDWESGKKFLPGSEMREYTCPAWWFQSADYSQKPDWDECIGIGAFSACKYFGNKKACWARHDQERV